MSVTVRLQAHFANQGDETAAGLFVGRDETSAYFITVRHALVYDAEGHPDASPDAPPVRAQSVKLWFRNRPQPLDASASEHVAASLDLGVVYVPLANLPGNLPQIVRANALVGTSVHIIGHPAAGEWSVWQGTVLNENAGDDAFHFRTTSNPSLAKGYSGGAEFDPIGNFLGMQVETTATYGSAAKSAEIAAQLKAWQIPTNNVLDAPPESDTDAIKRVLHLYEEAYNQRDADALWKVWPSPPPKTRSNIEKTFPTARFISLKLRYSDSAIKIDGLTATVSGQETLAQASQSGDTHAPREDAVIFTLKKNSGVWIIVGVQ